MQTNETFNDKFCLRNEGLEKILRRTLIFVCIYGMMVTFHILCCTKLASVLQVYTHAHCITTVLQDIAMNAVAELVVNKKIKAPKEARAGQSLSSESTEQQERPERPKKRDKLD